MAYALSASSEEVWQQRQVTVLLQNEESAQSITKVGCIFLWETLLLQLKFDDDEMIFLTGISTFKTYRYVTSTRFLNVRYQTKQYMK